MVRTKTRTLNYFGGDSYSTRSDSNRDLGMFLIFVGVVGSVPLYYLFNALVLRNPDWDWRMGASLGLVCVVAGVALMRLTQCHFRVLHDERSGVIEVRDGFMHGKMQYNFGPQAVVRLQATSVTRRGADVDCWEVELIDGKNQFLLDSKVERLQESRALAEFLARSMGCPMVVTYGAGDDVSIAAADLDLSYSKRVKKYPALLGPKVERPRNCPVTVRDVDGGTGRIYSWGVLASGLLVETIGVFLAAAAVGLIPVFGKVGDHYSLFKQAVEQHDFSYFIVCGFLVGVAVILQLGYHVEVAVRGERILATGMIWGISVWKRSILVESVEEIASRVRHNGVILQLVSDEMIVTVKLGRLDTANYVTSDLRWFVASGKAPVLQTPDKV